IPAFVRRALDERYGRPAAERLARIRERLSPRSIGSTAREERRGQTAPGVRLIEYDADAERKVVAAALFPHSNRPFDQQDADVGDVLDRLLADRSNRRQRAPRALEHAEYTF